MSHTFKWSTKVIRFLVSMVQLYKALARGWKKVEEYHG